MKKAILIVIAVGFAQLNLAQNSRIDSLRQQLILAITDDDSVKWLGSIAEYYAFVQFDSSIIYANKTFDISNRSNNVLGKYNALKCMGLAANCKGNYPNALEIALSMLKITEKSKSNIGNQLSGPHYFLGLLNREMGNLSGAIDELQLAIQIQRTSGQPMAEIFFAFSQLAIIYGKQNQMDSALINARKGYDLGFKAVFFQEYFSLALAALGDIHRQMGHNALAKDYFLMGIQHSKSHYNKYLEARNYNQLASLYNKTGLLDSCIYYAGISLQLCQQHNFSEFKLDAAHLLTQVYEVQNKPDSALKYIKLELEARDSVFSQSKVRQFQKVAFDEQLHQREINISKERYINQVKLFSLLTASGIFLIIGYILYRNNQQKQRSNKEIKKAYDELQTTQAQLIQSEKMASLGELTAGIAHEIQNPLNFVNNFSEVNIELIDELELEANKGNLNEVKLIAKDIKENEKKISHHGNRADSIVKAMLQHSRTNTGKKEPTEINSLADEYLQLAYHGLRARDKDFNATLKTAFDSTIGKINIIPQDIGRILLNLYNNAFYVVGEKKKLQLIGFEPTVEISTKKVSNKVEIRVKDNGNGIPQQILDKIFQPFFTTKPTGQGTGLGLSMSYDIVKAHGGEIKVETKEGEFTEFVVILPS